MELENYLKGKTIESVKETENGLEIVFKEEKFVPKDGDFVKLPYDGLGIFKEKCIEGEDESIVYCFMNRYGDLSVYENDRRCNYSLLVLATESEKQTLLDALAKVGKRWNAEKKQIEKIRWRAEKGGKYWLTNCIPEDGDATFHPTIWTDTRSTFDNAQYECGDYSKTEEECQSICDELNAVLYKRKNN